MDKEFEIESAYLESTIRSAKEQISNLRETSEKIMDDIIKQKQEMREEAKHSISSNLWSSDNFDQLVELSQFAAQASLTVNQYETNVKNIDKLEKLVVKPYFARVDFKFDDNSTLEKIYIGRYPLIDEDTFEWLVYDWRAPISSLFYRYGTGRAFYEAPAGNISGDISLKRQYEISEGNLKFYFDADMQILDDFLREMLAHNASNQMKSIIETIQKDQDMIIRNISSDLMMVQGVAGSGKTSVALHRVAYLMYQGLNQKLSSQDIIIISPNTLFESYISHVLPELGEENVKSFLFDELYEMIFDQEFQRKNEMYESLLTSYGEDHEIVKRSLEFKMSNEYTKVLDKLDIQEYMPIESIIATYNLLFTDEDYFRYLTRDCEINNLDDIRKYTINNMYRGKTGYEDASAIVYLYLKANGYEEYRLIKHVVVDEAQDYYPLHFQILRIMFPNAKFTVLGDVNQTIAKHENISFYDMVRDVFKKRKSNLVSMEKSFRCTHQILDFSRRFIDMNIESFSRDGEVPQIIKRNHDTDFESLRNEIKACKEAGYKSIGIHCKTEEKAKRLFEMLEDKAEIELILSHTNSSLTGTFILPIYLSKGLEFDVAILWDVDHINYNTREDRQLLYIGCTRALHRLTLFHLGDISPLCIDSISLNGKSI